MAIPASTDIWELSFASEQGPNNLCAIKGAGTRATNKSDACHVKWPQILPFHLQSPSEFQW